MHQLVGRFLSLLGSRPFFSAYSSSTSTICLDNDRILLSASGWNASASGVGIPTITRGLCRSCAFFFAIVRENVADVAIMVNRISVSGLHLRLFVNFIAKKHDSLVDKWIPLATLYIRDRRNQQPLKGNRKCTASSTSRTGSSSNPRWLSARHGSSTTMLAFSAASCR